jgi:hypothetical protein
MGQIVAHLGVKALISIVSSPFRIYLLCIFYDIMPVISSFLSSTVYRHKEFVEEGI